MVILNYSLVDVSGMVDCFNLLFIIPTPEQIDLSWPILHFDINMPMH
jgi:hypothetical protein